LFHRWLRQNQHLRYMWLPYTDKVVVVQCNPASARAAAAAAASKPRYSRDEQLAPLRQLLASSAKASAGVGDVSELTATQLRDQLLVVNPLDKDWVAKVNQAEAEYWSR
jgi:L-galactono-1,4-lactone dehydrogenase